MTQEIFSYPIKKIGIIGGGQLGKMTAQVAKRMGFYVIVLDPVSQCPAAHIADAQIVGGLYDAEKLRALAQVSDVLTYDVEHIDTETLKQLQTEGYLIYPSPYTLEVIQDKLQQKQILAKHNIPIPRFQALTELTTHSLAHFGLPVVQKARFGGYDGKGVVVIQNEEDIVKALPAPTFIEEFIDFTKELAIIVARTPNRETICYPVVEMVFDDKTNICDIVVAPARIEPSLAEQARQIALRAIEALDGIGVFGVEMFLTRDRQILVNEIAPRPHNSGHYTIEACLTCQFEQLVRVISGLPLGASELLKPAVMFNLLGEPGYTGVPLIEGLTEALAIPGLSFHFYDKAITKPSRKMGHITILADQIETAIAQLQQIKNKLKIKGIEKL
jgi:5-(carboxyamino)imidazole ribonucleotide synthase